MYCFPVVRSVDINLGHVDYRSFSDQTLMELLIEGFDENTKRMCQDEDGMYIDVCEWQFVKCNVDDRVV